jgi:predicted protein tyrosine phosphatase
MEFRICGFVPGSWLLEQEPNQWNALIILDWGKRATSFVAAHACSHCYLHFDDVENPQPGKQPPTSILVEQGLAFARGKDKLLVSCRAGQSRSVAMAYLICCQERGAADAVNLLDPRKHRPNRRVIEIGDALLGDPEILDRFQAWRDRHSSIKLSDFHEQLEKEFVELEAQGAQDRITCH